MTNNYTKWFDENRDKWTIADGMKVKVKYEHFVFRVIETFYSANKKMLYCGNESGIHIVCDDECIPYFFDHGTEGILEAQIREKCPGSNITQIATFIDNPDKRIKWRLFIPCKLSQIFDTKTEAIIEAFKVI